MAKNNGNDSRAIDRRTVLSGIGAVGAGGILATGNVAGRGPGRGRGPGGGGPPGQSCDCEDSEGEFIAKYDVECSDGGCEFVLAEGEDGIDIDVSDVKDDDPSEPISVEFEADGYDIKNVCAYGGRDTDNKEDVTGITEFETDLQNPGGQQAAISNLTFCGGEKEEVVPLSKEIF